jgi:hypothetical protein
MRCSAVGCSCGCVSEELRSFENSNWNVFEILIFELILVVTLILMEFFYYFFEFWSLVVWLQLSVAVISSNSNGISRIMKRKSGPGLGWLQRKVGLWSTPESCHFLNNYHYISLLSATNIDPLIIILFNTNTCVVGLTNTDIRTPSQHFQPIRTVSCIFWFNLKSLFEKKIVKISIYDMIFKLMLKEVNSHFKWLLFVKHLVHFLQYLNIYDDND